MKVFSKLAAAAPEFMRLAAKQHGLEHLLTADYQHPEEDYFAISAIKPIFVVADGVTLELRTDGKYPNPSGAGELTKLFCETVIKEAEKAYDHFSEASLLALF